MMAQCPADFAEVARGKTYAELQRLYGVGATVIGRWRRECGLIRKKADDDAAGSDTPEQIAACLSCKFPDCRCSARICPVTGLS